MRTHRSRLLTAAIILVASIGATTVASAAAADPGDTQKTLRQHLTGYEETPLALSSPASGDFEARINDADQTITYTLSYSGFPTAVLQSHIHFGSPSQSGGISTFLCTNLGNGPAGTQTCPQSGTITGVITPANIIGPTAQGIAAGEWDELVAGIRHGTAYVNIHSQAFPGGEIRAQFEHDPSTN